MDDAELRALERRARETGAAEDEARHRVDGHLATGECVPGAACVIQPGLWFHGQHPGS